MRPDFTEIADVRTAEHGCIGVENFFPSTASRSAQAVIVTDNRREVEHAENHVAMVILADEAYDGIVGIVAPDPFKAGVVMVDFPQRRIFLVDVV